MYRKNILFFLLLVLISASCTEKEIVIPEYKPPTTKKAILVEEFTGVRCTNCPNGAEILKNMEEKYGDLIVPISIHSSDTWATPTKSSKYDFRTDDGNKLMDLLSPLLYPSASFNRVFFENQDEIPVSPPSLWQSSIEEELAKENVTFIDMISDYNPDTREINIKITISPLTDIEGDFKLSVALTEDKIIDAQTFEHNIIKKDYEFNNVLKDMITPYDGTLLGSNLAKGAKIVKSFKYTLPTSKNLWVAENINLVAFITGSKDNALLPVLNAVKKHLIE